MPLRRHPPATATGNKPTRTMKLAYGVVLQQLHRRIATPGKIHPSYSEGSRARQLSAITSQYNGGSPVASGSLHLLPRDPPPQGHLMQFRSRFFDLLFNLAQSKR